ncbi:MAG TPA: hypothetical protein VGD67_28650, partial [Pseudonocardiaceae bacterium]
DVRLLLRALRQPGGGVAGGGTAAEITGGRDGTREGALLVEQLGRGLLLLLSTESDGPLDWLRAGWAAQNAWLTTAARGLTGAVVGGVLDAPGVRATLAARLGLGGCPQLLLRVGWSVARRDPPAGGAAVGG